MKQSQSNNSDPLKRKLPDNNKPFLVKKPIRNSACETKFYKCGQCKNYYQTSAALQIHIKY